MSTSPIQSSLSPSPIKSLDDLPDELLVEIFYRFATLQDCQSMFFVSRKWKQLAEGEMPNYINTRHVPFYLFGNKPMPYISRWHTNLKYLDLRGVTLSDAQIKNTASACPKLRSLLIDSQMTDQAIVHLTVLQSLEVLGLYKCDQVTNSGLKDLAFHTKLKVLGLYRGLKVTNTGLQHLQALSNLESLALRIFPLITHSGIKYFHPKHLTTLGLYNCPLITRLGSVAGYVNLVSLAVSECPQVKDEELLHLKLCSKLKVLDLSRCVLLTDAGLEHLDVLNLKTLDLTKCSKVTEDKIALLGEKWTVIA